MARITIRNLDEEIMRKIRLRAIENGRSMEEEAHTILHHALAKDPMPEKGLGTAIHQLFKTASGIEPEISPRQPMRKSPSFD